MPTLSIDIEARFAQAIDAVNNLTRQVESSTKRMQRAFSSITTLGIGAGVALFARAVSRSIDEVENLGRAAEKTGLSIEKISALKFAAALEDIDFDTLQADLLKFNKALDESSKSFKRIGVDIKGLTPEQALDKTADAFARMADGSGKSAIAMDLFGKSGAQLIPLLNKGAAGFAEAARQAEQFGLIVRGPTLEAVGRYKDQLDLLEQASKGATLQIGTRMVPALTQIATEAARAAQESGLLTAAVVALAQAGKVTLFGADPNAIGKQAKFVEDLNSELKDLNAELAKIQAGDFDLPLDEMGLAPIQLRNTEEIRLKMREIGTVTLPKAEAVLKRMRAEADALAKALKKTGEQPATRENDQVKQRLEALAKELQGTEKLSEMEKVVQDIYEGRLGIVNATQKAQLYTAAKVLDAARLEIANEKALSDAAQHRLDSLHDADVAAAKDAETLNTALEAQAKALREVADPLGAVQQKLDDLDYLQATLGAAGLNAEQEKAVRLQLELQRIDARHAGPAEQFLNAIDPARQYRLELEKINLLEKEGRLDAQQAAQARKEVQKQIDTSDRDLEHIRGLVDPTRELRRELEVVDEKFASGLIDEQQAERAKAIIRRNITETLADAGDMAAQTQLVMEDALVDPFIDLVKGAKSADDALKSFFDNVSQALLRLAAQKVSEQLFGSLFGMFSGTGTVVRQAGFSSAGGNIMTEHGPVKLQRYARGGITNRPVLSLAGENGPEAIIPLPDGRAVPVVLKGLDRGALVPQDRGIVSALVTDQRRGPKGQQSGGPMVLQIHPDAMHMTLRDWFEGELARQAATR